MNKEKDLLDLLLKQDGDYRQWEETFFTACRDYLAISTDWNSLLLTSRVYPRNVQAKTEYLLHVFRHETGLERFSANRLRFDGVESLSDSFWTKDFMPDFNYNHDKMAMRFGLQRGLMLDRFHQFMTTGMN